MNVAPETLAAAEEMLEDGQVRRVARLAELRRWAIIARARAGVAWDAYAHALGEVERVEAEVAMESRRLAGGTLQ